MVFVTIFTRLKNVHLLKDVGQIPYYMYRDGGYRSVIVTNKNDKSYSDLEDKVKGVRLRYIKGKGIFYVIRCARRIDVLNVYHLNLQSFYLLWLFKLLKRKGAKSYLKLDMDDKGYDRLFMKNPVGMIKRLTIKAADVVSAETNGIYDKLRAVYGEKVIFVTNGYYTLDKEPQKNFSKKNVILTAGMLGTEPKATDVLIKAFVKAAGDRKDWSLKLAGPVAEGFKNPYPEDERICFTGEITDRDKLNEMYREAKIFAFPSRHESFGIAMLEAAACGDYIISTTGVPAAGDIIDVTGAGDIVPPDDPDSLAEALKRAMEPDFDRNVKPEEIAERTFKYYSWSRVVSGLIKALNP